ncbi:MAG: c-type cytochrome, partial [Candidatus Hydrogenedentes bacterium]|nr:c-type cytochrome [Candidatus Hydrogenedentota bacterium]
LVQGNGAKGPGLYRLTDEDGDDEADQVKLIMRSDGGMGEHGPHAVLRGPDGYVYIQYGNHAHPMVDMNPLSPSRDLREDFFLDRYVDPRGHANHIKAPGGTILRVDPEFKDWHQVGAGFRNAYDMSMDQTGELFTFDSDMEWDYGLPWYRPIRVIHAIPGGDYGWRTGSSKKPGYYLDTPPGVDRVGRGSPVGVCFYEHDAFPAQYKGAFFMGDWARGRIRVIFPKAAAGSYRGKTVDFLVGEPLNVTDLDVGPDGALYFTLGGRGTQGGLYRVTYGDGAAAPDAPTTVGGVLTQSMPRSAWGRHAIAQAKETLGDEWATALQKAAQDATLPGTERIRALEALQVYGPQPDAAMLITLARDADPLVQGASVFLMGCGSLETYREPLINALYDKNATVVRRACEALVRSGLNESTRVETHEGLISGLYLLLNREERIVRYAARLALERIHRDLWAEHMLGDEFERRPHGVLEGVLALIETQRAASHADAIFEELEALSRQNMDEAILLDYLRVLQMALIRDVTGGDRLAQFKATLGTRMLAQFPAQDWRVNRELQAVIAYLQPPGAVDALLAYLTPDKSQEEQIYTMYALRTISTGWTEATRNQAVAWFDQGRKMAGAASMEGYINNMWNSLLAHLPETERVVAQKRKAQALKARAEAATALLAQIEGEAGEVKSDLAQMSFEELADYLEYDPMAYREQKLADGEKIFLRARCANCHIFGTKGKGGGPDLSTVTSRFRRRDILEAIMYPSKVVSDQYTGVELELEDFSIITGMVVGENDESITIITLQGERMEINRSDIVEQTSAEQSTMPEGLLNTMTLQNLVTLIYFLENGAEF